MNVHVVKPAVVELSLANELTAMNEVAAHA